MKQSIKFINALRFFTLLFSLIGLGCHFAQCTLLNVYQNKIKITMRPTHCSCKGALDIAQIHINMDLTFGDRCLLVDSTYVASIAVSLLWIVLVISSCMIKSSKRMSDHVVPVLPNEHDKSTWKISSASNKRTSTPKKYATPIAPHGEKLELPGSYDHRNSNNLSRLQVDRYSMLSRQYPPPNASNALPGAYVSPTHTPSSFYYS
ncbi:hypothetical protein MBANPS3_001213 [Mucor bainieri]